MGITEAIRQEVATDTLWSVRMANSVMARVPPAHVHWHYDIFLQVMAVEQVGRMTDDGRYWNYAKTAIDQFIAPDGTIRTYRLDEYNLDQINPGKLLFLFYEATNDQRYKRAIIALRQQLDTQPRTPSGGFWHKQIYPNQMWLDGLYMAAPFYAAYARLFNEPALFDDIVHQFALIERHARDPHSGLLYHGWDESKQQPWADQATGCSPHFWGRAVGWYLMALVDVLDLFPADHPQYDLLITALQRTVEAIAPLQDASSGLWYQILDQSERAGNYLEASASCMFVYAIAKGVRQGYLNADWLQVARRGYAGILHELITVDDAGTVSLEKVCSVAGLGGTPYRDGSFAYYVNEPIRQNDPKGVGPFILAALELEQAGG